MVTTRQEIIRLLEEEECDARMISREIGISEKDAYDHLPNIIRTVAAQKKQLIITPARCLACGYQFRKRGKISKPGRCPVCKKERVDPPRFHIE